MEPTLGIHLKFGRHLVDEPLLASSVAEILSRPCFRVLDRLCARVNGHRTHHTEPSALAIARHLTNSFVDGAHLDAKEGREFVALCEVENGARIREMMPPSIRYAVILTIPFVEAEVSDVVTAACDLASCLQAGAGYVALEPRFGWALEIALGRSRPRERPGVSLRRFQERRGRSAYDDRLVTELGGLEWGTFLGGGHLARIDMESVRASGAFARVVQLGPELVYLQVTENAADDLTNELEDRLVAARQILAPVLMPVAHISLA